MDGVTPLVIMVIMLFNVLKVLPISYKSVLQEYLFLCYSWSILYEELFLLITEWQTKEYILYHN